MARQGQKIKKLRSIFLDLLPVLVFLILSPNCTETGSQGNRRSTINGVTFEAAKTTLCDDVLQKYNGKMFCYEESENADFSAFSGLLTQIDEKFVLIDSAHTQYSIKNEEEISADLQNFVEKFVKVRAKLVEKLIYLDALDLPRIKEPGLIIDKDHIVISDPASAEFECSLTHLENCNLTVSESIKYTSLFRTEFDAALKVTKIQALSSGTLQDQYIRVIDNSLRTKLEPFTNKIFSCEMGIDKVATEEMNGDVPLFSGLIAKTCEATEYSALISFAESCVLQGKCKSSTVAEENASFVNIGRLMLVASHGQDRLIFSSSEDNESYFISSDGILDFVPHLEQDILVTGIVKIYNIVTNADQNLEEAVLFLKSMESANLKNTFIRISLRAKSVSSSGIAKFVNLLGGEDEYQFGFSFTRGSEYFSDLKAFKEVNLNSLDVTKALSEINTQQIGTVLDLAGVVSSIATNDAGKIIKTIQPISVRKKNSDDTMSTVFPNNDSANLPKNSDEVQIINIFSTIKSTNILNIPESLCKDGEDDAPEKMPDKYFQWQAHEDGGNRTKYPYVDTIINDKNVRLILLDDSSDNYNKSILYTSADTVTPVWAIGFFSSPCKKPFVIDAGHEVWIVRVYYATTYSGQKRCSYIPANAICVDEMHE